jgi:hypothetical protein
MQKHDGVAGSGDMINHLSKRGLCDPRGEDRRRNVIGNSLPRGTAKPVADSQSHGADEADTDADSSAGLFQRFNTLRLYHENGDNNTTLFVARKRGETAFAEVSSLPLGQY